MSGDEQAISFSTFAISLATNAAVFFGDIAEPGSSTPAEPNMEGARHMISVLEMLQTKTQGNLTPQERELLEQILYELRMRFVKAQQGEKRIIEP
jgi:hypothetical protein